MAAGERTPRGEIVVAGGHGNVSRRGCEFAVACLTGVDRSYAPWLRMIGRPVRLGTLAEDDGS